MNCDQSIKKALHNKRIFDWTWQLAWYLEHRWVVYATLGIYCLTHTMWWNEGVPQSPVVIMFSPKECCWMFKIFCLYSYLRLLMNLSFWCPFRISGIWMFEWAVSTNLLSIERNITFHVLKWLKTVVGGYGSPSDLLTRFSMWLVNSRLSIFLYPDLSYHVQWYIL